MHLWLEGSKKPLPNQAYNNNNKNKNWEEINVTKKTRTRHIIRERALWKSYKIDKPLPTSTKGKREVNKIIQETKGCMGLGIMEIVRNHRLF